MPISPNVMTVRWLWGVCECTALIIPPAPSDLRAVQSWACVRRPRRLHALNISSLRNLVAFEAISFHAWPKHAATIHLNIWCMRPWRTLSTSQNLVPSLPQRRPRRLYVHSPYSGPFHPMWRLWDDYGECVSATALIPPAPSDLRAVQSWACERRPRRLHALNISSLVAFEAISIHAWPKHAATIHLNIWCTRPWRTLSTSQNMMSSLPQRRPRRLHMHSPYSGPFHPMWWLWDDYGECVSALLSYHQPPRISGLCRAGHVWGVQDASMHSISQA